MKAIKQSIAKKYPKDNIIKPAWKTMVMFSGCLKYFSMALFFLNHIPCHSTMFLPAINPLHLDSVNRRQVPPWMTCLFRRSNAYVPFIAGPESEWDRVLSVARVKLSWISRIWRPRENLRLVEFPLHLPSMKATPARR